MIAIRLKIAHAQRLVSCSLKRKNSRACAKDHLYLKTAYLGGPYFLYLQTSMLLSLYTKTPLCLSITFCSVALYLDPLYIDVVIIMIHVRVKRTEIFHRMRILTSSLARRLDAWYGISAINVKSRSSSSGDSGRHIWNLIGVFSRKKAEKAKTTPPLSTASWSRKVDPGTSMPVTVGSNAFPIISMSGLKIGGRLYVI